MASRLLVLSKNLQTLTRGAAVAQVNARNVLDRPVHHSDAYERPAASSRICVVCKLRNCTVAFAVGRVGALLARIVWFRADVSKMFRSTIGAIIL